MLQASRTVGPAPLAVLFDATGSVAAEAGVDAFRSLDHEFNFGDDRGQVWALSGQPKNVQRGGPLAAHVFDLPGTYNVLLRVRTASGHSAEQTVIITVQDPDVLFAGSRTVCVSALGNYSACPAGAAQQSTLPASLDGKRVLLRRGEAFGAINIRHEDDGVVVGAYGSGPKPQVSQVAIGAGRPTVADFPDDITVMDLDVANGIEQSGSASRLLLYRNDLDDAGPSANNRIVVGGALEYWGTSADPYRVVPTSAFYNPHEIFIVENRVQGSTDNDANPLGNFYGTAARMAFLGNDMGGASQHTIRLFRAHKTVLAHSALRGRSNDGVRHSLKVHSGGFGAYSDALATSGETWATRQLVIADNLMGDPADNNGWTVAIRPQNDGPDSAEGIEDVIVERNRFVRGPNTNTDLLLVGRRISTRHNTRADGGALNISVHPQGAYPGLPSAWRGPYFIE
jgi:hypothetical protein